MVKMSDAESDSPRRVRARIVTQPAAGNALVTCPAWKERRSWRHPAVPVARPARADATDAVARAPGPADPTAYGGLRGPRTRSPSPPFPLPGPLGPVQPSPRRGRGRERTSSVRRLRRALLVLLPALALTAACAAPGSTPSSSGGSSAGGEVVKIGVADGSENYWKVYKDKAAAQGITVEFVNFTDYTQPNPALSQGQFHLNEFQHLQYLANYNVNNNDTLVPIGATAVVPAAAVLDEAHVAWTEIPQGGQVAIPNDPTNQARALLVLRGRQADHVHGRGHLGLHARPTSTRRRRRSSSLPVDAAQTAGEPGDVDAAIVNNNYATDGRTSAPTRLHLQGRPVQRRVQAVHQRLRRPRRRQGQPDLPEDRRALPRPGGRGRGPPGPGRRRRCSRPTTRPTCRPTTAELGDRSSAGRAPEPWPR